MVKCFVYDLANAEDGLEHCVSCSVDNPTNHRNVYHRKATDVVVTYKASLFKSLKIDKSEIIKFIKTPSSAEQYTDFVIIPQYYFPIPSNFLNTAVP